MFFFLLQFPRLQGTSTFKLYKVVFILHPEPEDEYSRNGGEIGQINMSKVRSYVTSLGDNLPEGARGLMQSMEEYQQVYIYSVFLCLYSQILVPTISK